MTPTPHNWNEDKLSERPALALLQSLGYTYVPPETLESERPTLKSTILESRLATALQRINPWLSSDNLAKGASRE